MFDLQSVLQTIDNFVWGAPLLILLVGTGVYLTVRLRLIQIFSLPRAFSYMFRSEPGQGAGDVSAFAALCTALSATIGTGNIVGVATAIKAGGPGALFWMWMAAFFGMATKYAECLLAVKYRVKDANGQMAGGPMYYIEKGLGLKWLASLFAVFGIGVAFFGIGTFPQVNAITESLQNTFGFPIWITATVLTCLVAAVTLGGIKRISAIAQLTVPFMALFYVAGSVLLLMVNYHKVPDAVILILTSAFNPDAAVGGALGLTIQQVMKSGIARGVFSNESGLGSAPIAAAAARTNEPVRQGLVSMTGTFIDTLVICTMTGLALVVTGVWNTPLSGAAMTNAAFATGLNELGQWVVTIGLMFFAFTTILGWNYYGERCVTYLFGTKGIRPYRWIFILLVASGAFLKLDTIWILADIVNGLMAIPNLIALVGLRHVVVAETRDYFARMKLPREAVEAV
ncbi:sodium:alanine symporter family protein [Plesiomonas shigelloides]|uniref:alanine/glycine:cation symporter family protein n=1 Tax=Plesiomonas shigelloides TaxID=703 RepID=UPI002885AACD|nr:sodium:alanine symporter family protein [Plesiomonas shigelloides]MDT1010324.1 sodium:alanine symporter family protein [Plesiomonas shigelloides]